MFLFELYRISWSLCRMICWIFSYYSCNISTIVFNKFQDLWYSMTLHLTNTILFKGYWNSKCILILIMQTKKGYLNYPLNGSLDNLVFLFSPYNDNGSIFWILATLANPCNHCTKPSFSSLGDGEHVGMQMYQRKC